MNGILKKYVVGALVTSSALFFVSTSKGAKSIKYLDKANSLLENISNPKSQEVQKYSTVDTLLKSARYLIKAFDRLNEAMLDNTKYGKELLCLDELTLRDYGPRGYVFDMSNIFIASWKKGQMPGMRCKSFDKDVIDAAKKIFESERVLKKGSKYYVIYDEDKTKDDFLAGCCSSPDYDFGAIKFKTKDEIWSHSCFLNSRIKADVDDTVWSKEIFEKFTPVIYSNLNVDCLQDAYAVWMQKFIEPASQIVNSLCSFLNAKNIDVKSLERLLELYKRILESNPAYSYSIDEVSFREVPNFVQLRHTVHSFIFNLIVSLELGRRANGGDAEAINVIMFLSGIANAWNKRCDEFVGEFKCRTGEKITYRTAGYYQLELWYFWDLFNRSSIDQSIITGNTVGAIYYVLSRLHSDRRDAYFERKAAEKAAAEAGRQRYSGTSGNKNSPALQNRLVCENGHMVMRMGF